MNMLLFTTDKWYIEEQQTGERRGKTQLVRVIHVISFFWYFGKIWKWNVSLWLKPSNFWGETRAGDAQNKYGEDMMMRSQIFAPLCWNGVDEWVVVGRLFHKKGIHNPSAITSPHHVLRKTQIDGRSFAMMQLALFIANPGIVSIVNALATMPRGQSAV